MAILGIQFAAIEDTRDIHMALDIFRPKSRVDG